MDSDGKIIKRFVRTGEDIDWPHLEMPCRQAIARKILLNDSYEMNKVYFQHSEVIKENKKDSDQGDGGFFCQAIKVKKTDDKVVALCVGCRYKHAQELLSFTANELEQFDIIKVSPASCPSSMEKLCEWARKYPALSCPKRKKPPTVS